MRNELVFPRCVDDSDAYHPLMGSLPNGWMIDKFGFGAAFSTMAVSYVLAGLLLLFIRKE